MKPPVPTPTTPPDYTWTREELIMLAIIVLFFAVLFLSSIFHWFGAGWDVHNYRWYFGEG